MRIESWHCGAPIGPIAIILFPIVLEIAAADIKDASGHLHRLQSDFDFCTALKILHAYCDGRCLTRNNNGDGERQTT